MEEEFIEIGVDEMKNGIKFKSEAIAVKSIEKWCEKSFCPLTKTRYRRRAMNIENGKIIYARRDWKCCHSIK